MYQWCRNSQICYVYLGDVGLIRAELGHEAIYLEGLEESRWFTRGWTLQELIAPSIVEIYDTDVSMIWLLPIIRNVPSSRLPCPNFQIFLKKANTDFTIL
jgi:hypothetical protein